MCHPSHNCSSRLDAHQCGLCKEAEKQEAVNGPSTTLAKVAFQQLLVMSSASASSLVHPRLA